MKVNATQFKILFYASPIYTTHTCIVYSIVFSIYYIDVVWSHILGNLCIYLLYSPFCMSPRLLCVVAVVVVVSALLLLFPLLLAAAPLHTIYFISHNWATLWEGAEGGTQWGLRIGIEIGTKRLVFFSFGIGIRHDSRNLQQYFIKGAHTGDPRAVVKRCPRLACEREDILGYIINPTVG